MNRKQTTPAEHDREQGQQGISNRPDDEPLDTAPDEDDEFEDDEEDESDDVEDDSDEEA
jgi:hypothetical protein